MGKKKTLTGAVNISVRVDAKRLATCIRYLEMKGTYVESMSSLNRIIIDTFCDAIIDARPELEVFTFLEASEELKKVMSNNMATASLRDEIQRELRFETKLKGGDIGEEEEEGEGEDE